MSHYWKSKVRYILKGAALGLLAGVIVIACGWVKALYNGLDVSLLAGHVATVAGWTVAVLVVCCFLGAIMGDLTADFLVSSDPGPDEQ